MQPLYLQLDSIIGLNKKIMILLGNVFFFRRMLTNLAHSMFVFALLSTCLLVLSSLLFYFKTEVSGKSVTSPSS